MAAPSAAPKLRFARRDVTIHHPRPLFSAISAISTSVLLLHTLLHTVLVRKRRLYKNYPYIGDSRIQSNVADTTPSDPPPFLGYYKDVDWSRITGRWGPAPGGKGKGNSSIWDHVERFNYMPGRITIRRWIKTGYHNSLPLIQQAIDTSQSKIHCSFDIWTSRKMVAFCGIHIHFLYKGKYKSLLLALPRQVGTHSGVNIAAGIMEVFNSFRITSDRIGYFVSDNAHPNNTCMEELAIRLEFSYDERRLQCAGHIINLIAEVMLRGQDKKAVEPEDDSSVDADADAVALKYKVGSEEAIISKHDHNHPSTRAPLEALPTPSQDTSQAYPSQGPLEIPEETDPRRDRQIICTNINLGWGKLMKYYTKTDLSAAYVAALILHPRYNWSWLKKKWCHRVDWLTAADDRMRALWQSYSTFPLPQRPTRARAQPQQRTGQLNLLWSDDEDDDSEQEVELEEYAAWIERAQVKDIYRPLEYWTSKHASSQWPRLSRLAVDIFTIPAMSDDPERTFSSAGLMVRPHRGLLKDDSITETQYLKNWLKGDMVTMAVFASQMEEETTPIQGTTTTTRQRCLTAASPTGSTHAPESPVRSHMRKYVFRSASQHHDRDKVTTYNKCKDIRVTVDDMGSYLSSWFERPYGHEAQTS
ncbi:unnamed protein product [Aureobasidium pullulans]|nr:unnamed protein product [Aureobasidium pullulans]